MREELRSALQPDITLLKLTVAAPVFHIGPVTGTHNNMFMPTTTTGVQSVAKDTLGIAVMPKWCADSLDYLPTVSLNFQSALIYC